MRSMPCIVTKLETDSGLWERLPRLYQPRKPWSKAIVCGQCRLPGPRSQHVIWQFLAVFAETANRVLFVAVIGKQHTDARHFQKPANFRTGIYDLHAARIPHQMGITSHKLA